MISLAAWSDFSSGGGGGGGFSVPDDMFFLGSLFLPGLSLCLGVSVSGYL